MVDVRKNNDLVHTATFNNVPHDHKQEESRQTDTARKGEVNLPAVALDLHETPEVDISEDNREPSMFGTSSVNTNIETVLIDGSTFWNVGENEANDEVNKDASIIGPNNKKTTSKKTLKKEKAAKSKKISRLAQLDRLVDMLLDSILAGDEDLAGEPTIYDDFDFSYPRYVMDF